MSNGSRAYKRHDLLATKAVFVDRNYFGNPVCSLLMRHFGDLHVHYLYLWKCSQLLGVLAN